MRVGFTGSRHKITQAQADTLASRLRVLRDDHGADELHHGDCVEGDEVAARLASGLGLRTVAHPPTNDRFRAFFPSDEILPARPFLDRDRDIVEVSAVLIGCPRMREEGDPRSGTWYTIRRARRARIGLIVVATSGVVVESFRPAALGPAMGVFACTS